MCMRRWLWRDQHPATPVVYIDVQVQDRVRFVDPTRSDGHMNFAKISRSVLKIEEFAS